MKPRRSANRTAISRSTPVARAIALEHVARGRPSAGISGVTARSAGQASLAGEPHVRRRADPGQHAPLLGGRAAAGARAPWPTRTRQVEQRPRPPQTAACGIPRSAAGLENREPARHAHRAPARIGRGGHCGGAASSQRSAPQHQDRQDQDEEAAHDPAALARGPRLAQRRRSGQCCAPRQAQSRPGDRVRASRATSRPALTKPARARTGSSVASDQQPGPEGGDSRAAAAASSAGRCCRAARQRRPGSSASARRPATTTLEEVGVAVLHAAAAVQPARAQDVSR